MNAESYVKPARQPCPAPGSKPRNCKQTLRDFVTENETRTGLIKFLKKLVDVEPGAEWKNYLEFYLANQSGDMTSFKPEGKAFIKKFVKELHAKWNKRNESSEDEEETNATTKK